MSNYFFQFHANTVDQVQQIGEFLKNKKHDPLLKICVGVSADHFLIENENESTMKAIFEICNLYNDFVPILHFSFRKSQSPSEDLKIIKNKFPFIKYIQLNDLPSIDLRPISLACQMFLADVPLSDDNFELVHNPEFRKVIIEYKAFVLLDNSRGRGIQESKEGLMRKIDTLLQYGLTDIAIFGGFGPNDLHTYFELRRHYGMNFSIDAETKLKTNGQIDIEKTKTYLSQLIDFDMSASLM